METEKLKALALAAPGAPWKVQHPYARARGWEVADSSGLNQVCENVTKQIADYIAAACPTAVLELCNERDALAAEVKRLRAELAAGAARQGSNTNKVGCERDDGLLNIHSESETCEVCAAPAAGTEKDAERLDFMIAEECQVEEMMRRGDRALYRVRWPCREEHQREWSKSARDAIDAAIAAYTKAEAPPCGSR